MGCCGRSVVPLPPVVEAAATAFASLDAFFSTEKRSNSGPMSVWKRKPQTRVGNMTENYYSLTCRMLYKLTSKYPSKLCKSSISWMVIGEPFEFPTLA